MGYLCTKKQKNKKVMKNFIIEAKVTGRETRSLSDYLNEVKKIPLLSREREVELSAIIKKGGNDKQKAVDELVKGNLRFAFAVAKGYQWNGLELDDLVQEANIGLIKAANQYVDGNRCRFLSFAVFKIRKAIMQGIENCGRLVRLPKGKEEEVARFRDFSQWFMQQYEREPTVEEYLSETGCKNLFELKRALSLECRHRSLDKPLEEGASMTFGETLDGGNATVEELNRQMAHHEIDQCLRRFLEQEEVDFLYDAFGFDTVELDTKALAVKYKMNVRKVIVYKSRILTKIRTSAYAVLIKKYLLECINA